MGKAKGRKTFLLAPLWERIGRVRDRFRKGKPWLRFPQDEDDAEIVLSTKSLGYNHEVLSALFTTIGLKVASIKFMQREVVRLEREIGIRQIYIYIYIYVYLSLSLSYIIAMVTKLLETPSVTHGKLFFYNGDGSLGSILEV